MQNSTLIKQNIQKLVLHHRKTIINEVVQTGILREAFNSNRLPKDLTEEQLLFVLSEYLSEDGNFILENYKILIHPNPTPEMLNEGRLDVVWKGIKNIPQWWDDAIKWGDEAWQWGKNAFKWVWKKVGDTWEWVWSGPPGSTPDVPKPTKPGRIPDSWDGPNGIPPDGPLNTPNGFPTTMDPHFEPWDDRFDLPDYEYNFPPELPDIFAAPQGPPQWLNPVGPNGLPLGESMSKFNRNMKHLMESNHQIDQNLLHSMLNQVNESKYLLELAIQRNQVNRIIDRI